MSTEHSTGAPAVAVGPYTARQGSRSDEWTVTSAGDALLAVVFETVACPDVEAQAHLLATSWDLLAACEKAAEVMGWMRWDQSDRRDKNEAYTLVKTAIARARGLRPCDDPTLVPEVLQAQPQCVHGEKAPKPATYTCPAHPESLVWDVRHEHPTTGGVWYTYVCDGYLEEQRGSGE